MKNVANKARILINVKGFVNSLFAICFSSLDDDGLIKQKETTSNNFNFCRL